MPTTSYAPGDVIHFSSGPFWGVCGVVRRIDAGSATMTVDFDEGIVHSEGGVMSSRRHSLRVGFDEVELA